MYLVTTPSQRDECYPASQEGSVWLCLLMPLWPPVLVLYDLSIKLTCFHCTWILGLHVRLSHILPHPPAASHFLSLINAGTWGFRCIYCFTCVSFIILSYPCKVRIIKAVGYIFFYFDQTFYLSVPFSCLWYHLLLRFSYVVLPKSSWLT